MYQVVTNRAVQKGQELTTAYDAFTPRFPWQDNWNFTCRCGASNCKKVINKYRMDIVYPIRVDDN